MTALNSRREILAITGASLTLAGCLGGEDDTDDSADDDPETDVAWRDATLEDVTTGESFTIAGIDRPVVVHTFAPFCPTCNRQQDGVTDDYAAVSDEMEFVDLVIDGNDDPDNVRAHAEENGHEWRFGVASEAFTGALVDEFGQEVAIHAQSPLIIVCPDGSATAIDKPAGISTIRNTIDTTCD